MVSENKLPRCLCKDKYKTIYMRLFTPCSYLLTKESYDWWIIRRKWGFKQQISEEKNLKESVANIWKHSGGFHRHATWAAKFRKLKVSILHKKADFATSTL